MREIFEATVINGMRVRNRLVRSATWEGMCREDGRPTERLAECYRELARGGVGLVITGYTFVRPDGKQLPGQMGIHTDDFAGEMKRMAEAVHGEGGAICVQLVHAGGQTTQQVIGRRPLAPSAVAAEQYGGVDPQEMSAADIADIVEAFGEGARRAKEWGFDAVQVHAAHGYLINQFISPLTNVRRDKYGGTVENRCRFLMQVYRRVRQAVGEDYPLLVKLNGSDNVEGGLEIGDAVAAALMLDEAGVDAIEVSGGTPGSGEQSPVREKINRPGKEAYNLALARAVKRAVGCPVMSVGGYRSVEVVAGAVRHDVDYVSLARPLIREPHLPRRWQRGDTEPATCISCNKCFRPGLKEGGIYCVVEREKEQQTKD